MDHLATYRPIPNQPLCPEPPLDPPDYGDGPDDARPLSPWEQQEQAEASRRMSEAIEDMVNQAAADLGIDRTEWDRRILAKTVIDFMIDSGDLPDHGSQLVAAIDRGLGGWPDIWADLR